MVIAIVVGRPGINTLLVISQVVLSIVLPFAMFPLIYLTSSKAVMRVRRSPEISRKELLSDEKDEVYDGQDGDLLESSEPLPDLCANSVEQEEVASIRSVDGVLGLPSQTMGNSEKMEKDNSGCAVSVKRADTMKEPSPVGEAEDEYVDYSNSWSITILSYAIWIVIIAANGYVIVTLAID